MTAGSWRMLSMWPANLGPLSRLLFIIPAKAPKVREKVPKMISTLDKTVKDLEFLIYYPVVRKLVQSLVDKELDSLVLASFKGFCQT